MIRGIPAIPVVRHRSRGEPGRPPEAGIDPGLRRVCLRVPECQSALRVPLDERLAVAPVVEDADGPQCVSDGGGECLTTSRSRNT